jgi:hypothetical protein
MFWNIHENKINVNVVKFSLKLFWSIHKKIVNIHNLENILVSIVFKGFINFFLKIHDDKSMLIIFAFLQTYRLGIYENS